MLICSNLGKTWGLERTFIKNFAALRIAALHDNVIKVDGPDNVLINQMVN